MWLNFYGNKSTSHLHRKHQKFSARWPWLGKPLWTRRKPVAQSNRTGTAGSSRSTAPQPGNSTGTSPVVSKTTHIQFLSKQNTVESFKFMRANFHGLSEDVKYFKGSLEMLFHKFACSYIMRTVKEVLHYINSNCLGG